LDECKNDQLARDFRDLVENKGLPPVKVIVFSRNEDNLEECFRPYNQIEPDLGVNEEDLKAHIYSLFPDDSQKKVSILRFEMNVSQRQTACSCGLSCSLIVFRAF
jgi:hypothetical protein